MRNSTSRYLLDDLYDDLLIPETRISPIPTNSNMMPITISVLNGVKNSNLVYSSIRRMKNGSFTWRNEEGKISANSFSQSRAITTTKPLIALTNHTGISHYLDRLCDNVESLFHKKAFIHQFKDLIEEDEIRLNMMKLRETSDMYKVQDELISAQVQEEMGVNDETETQQEQ
ncbi:uncharacterized protein TA06110 [Theileria annulata]|uniref:Uncharacterized protein n=1 Tax=Theileria annulata TaxID=5874 RepID=Q4UI60_THEAN|nr:uncharacterized protein TA06110 [Theileria annulata]CAI73229.1 hypothetical protein TA06110 [Theileria annulata]|eukprot:XP_953906.1 hypothetical protein TA06110 [Theileria annulata]